MQPLDLGTVGAGWDSLLGPRQSLTTLELALGHKQADFVVSIGFPRT